MKVAVPPRTAVVLLWAAALLAATLVGPAAGAATKSLVVEAGKQDRAHVPMHVEVPAGTTQARVILQGKDVPCQVAEGQLWWILDALPAGASRTYQVELGAAAPAAEGGVAIRQTDATVDIRIAGKPFTTYHFTNPKIAGQQLRRPYFWPVYGPGQVTMTRPWPLTDEAVPKNVAKDHPHHTSLWVAHGDVNGTDNWSIAAGAGWQVHKTFETVTSGPVVGTFREVLDWTDARKKPVLAEVRTVRVYRLPETARLLDLDIVFRAAYGAVKFGDTKEGGLCATRMRPEFRADGKGGTAGRLVNSEGQTADAAWGKKAAWLDCSGTVDGKRLGYALFDAPGNLRHPTTWHARTYGLATANPFGLKHFDKANESGDYTLEAGKETTLRYRIYFHPGDEKAARVADRWTDFAQPPTAIWK
ncbi:MAG TPA: PmoA family protein [Phycisphaerae bacterium]|nr:PmoA family protein [Phycisphaerae bacterium]